MGNTCCQDQNINSSQIQKVEGQLAERHANNEYYEAEWPTDQIVQTRLVQLRSKEEFAFIFQKEKVMKHKYMDKYYIGEWNSGGYPEGKGIMLDPDSYLYYGQFNIYPHGRGVLELFKEKIIYEGELKDGKGEGQGIITHLENKFRFEGTLKNSIPLTGNLQINNLHDSTKSFIIILEDFPHNKTKIEYSDGRTYEGQVNKRSFAPEGEGIATFPDHSKYEGNWEDGQMHGKGYFIWKDGSSYQGEYQHGRKHGEGTFTFVSKKRYVGQWANGKQNGKGVIYNQIGQIQKKGDWKDGVYQRNDEE